jgi:PhzF family phenazine biosynthesis protein
MRIYQVDSFTDKPFYGNPAGVCVLDEPCSEGFMQSLAAEMNLSETAFVLREDDEAFRLRWFTPVTEVSLCGHATLASAHILWTEGYLQPEEEARFNTLSGRLTAKKKSDWIEMNFPVRRIAGVELPESLVSALGVRPIYSGVRRKPSGSTYLVEVESEDLVASLRPDFRRLAATDARNVILTSRAVGKPYDFVSRFFAPAVGID